MTGTAPEGAAVLALFSSGTFDDDAAEWLRVLAALVAVGRPVRLFALGPGLPVLSRDDLPSESLRHLDALASFGVVPVAPTPAALRSALLECSSVFRSADPARSGSPPLLDLTDSRLASLSDEDLLRGILDAGQVLRSRTRLA